MAPRLRRFHIPPRHQNGAHVRLDARRKTISRSVGQAGYFGSEETEVVVCTGRVEELGGNPPCGAGILPALCAGGERERRQEPAPDGGLHYLIAPNRAIAPLCDGSKPTASSRLA